MRLAKWLGAILKYLISRGLIVGLIIFGLFSIGGVGLEFSRFLKTPLAIERDLTFEITPGMSIERVAEQLVAADILHDPKFFRWYGRITGQARNIKVGEYRIEAGSTPQDLLNAFTRGRVVQYSFTIIEGWTFKEMMARIAESDDLQQTLTGKTPEEIMALIGAEGAPYEGYFLPDTYFFPRNYTDRELLERSYRAMQRVLADAYRQKDPGLPINSPHELLTLASIVEKETGIAEERAAIAGVFTRRLQLGMRLQTDPTVIYGMGDRYQGTIYRSDLDRDTPYNTYTRAGLPPTPIAMPSVAAIYAAAMPEVGDALYFVAKGDGSGRHTFSATLEEHNRAVRLYRERQRQLKAKELK